jgi:hypothetical protein
MKVDIDIETTSTQELAKMLVDLLGPLNMQISIGNTKNSVNPDPWDGKLIWMVTPLHDKVMVFSDFRWGVGYSGLSLRYCLYNIAKQVPNCIRIESGRQVGPI